jgi:D-alanine-D-alanine ligase
MDIDKYNIYPVGITREGKWIYFSGTNYEMLPADTWYTQAENCPAAISPVRGQGLLLFHPEGVEEIALDVVFPVLHGENGEDGAVQGLMQLAGIPCVGPDVAASAVSMDKTLTKLVIDHAAIPQAKWYLVRSKGLENKLDHIASEIESRFSYPVFVKPSCAGSSNGVSKAKDRQGLIDALLLAVEHDDKILVEETICGREVECAVLGVDEVNASGIGEVLAAGDEGFYTFDSKYNNADSQTITDPELPEGVAEKIRTSALRIFKAVSGSGLSRVDFFVEHGTNDIVFNEINTLPGFTSISMYPMLWAARGIDTKTLVNKLIADCMNRFE